MRFTRLFEAGALVAAFLLQAAPAIADQHADDLKLGRQVYGNLASNGQIVAHSAYRARPHWFVERFYVIRRNQINAISAPGRYVFDGALGVGTRRSAQSASSAAGRALSDRPHDREWEASNYTFLGCAREVLRVQGDAGGTFSRMPPSSGLPLQ